MKMNASYVWQDCDFSCVEETYGVLRCDCDSYDHHYGYDDVEDYDVLDLVYGEG